MPAPTIRTIAEDDFGEWLDVTRTAMLGAPVGEGQHHALVARFDLDRCLAAVDVDDRLCGAAAAFPTTLTVPGGSVAAAGVTLVGVLPTHRRQGHLSRMMQSQLADVAARGEPVAALIAAEYPIYGRYGYGPATEACSVRVDALSLKGRADGWTSPPSGRVELVDKAAFAAALQDVYERARRRNAGHISWREHEYEVVAGLTEGIFGDSDGAPAARALWYDDSDHLQGAVSYTLKQNWEDNRPKGKLRALPLVAATDSAERELVRYLAAVDWVGTVHIGLRPVDDPVPLWLADGRNATLADRSDHVWVRILDVPEALAARRYRCPGSLVIEVADPMGFASGRYRLEVTATSGDPAPEGHPATCIPTDAEPDLVVGVAVLGATYLGGFSWTRLAAAGWVDERRPGTTALASTMFSTPRAPWCAMTF